jgi:F-type H+-transporting ATPase subunit epsilon
MENQHGNHPRRRGLRRESIFSGEAKFVALPGENGELGILPRHTPLITRIKPGAVRIERPTTARKSSSSSPAASWKCSRAAVTVLADTAIRGHDLDEAKAPRPRSWPKRR